MRVELDYLKPEGEKRENNYLSLDDKLIFFIINIWEFTNIIFFIINMLGHPSNELFQITRPFIVINCETLL